MKRRSRSVLAWTAALTLLSGAAACGLSPPNGVRVDRQVVGRLDDEPDVRRLPSGPRAGETPEQVVRGFLGAAAAVTEPKHELARGFLVPGARWNDLAGMTVYDPTSLTVRPVPAGGRSGTGAAFRLRADRIATLGPDGAYLPAEGRLDYVVRLTRVGRDWRIEAPPDGLLLTPRDLTRGYRPVIRYLLSPVAGVLVPDPVYLPGMRSTLAGTAVRALFTGPGSWLAPAVRSEVPPALTPLGSVVVSDGVAVVDLDRVAFDVPVADRPLLVGQLAATLGTVPGVDGVRVLAEGRGYQDRETIAPATIPPSLRPVLDGPTYAVTSAGGLLRVQAAAPGEPPAGVTAVPGSPARLLAAVADPAGSGSIAAFQFDGRGARLLLGPSGDLRLTGVPSGPLVGPTWLPGRGVVVVAPGPRLVLVTPGGVVQPFATPAVGLLGMPREIAISPDGSRLVFRTGPADPEHPRRGETSRTWLARIVEKNGRPFAEGWTEFATGIDDAAFPSWSSPTELVMTGRRSGSARGMWRVRIDRLADPERVPLAGLPAAPSAVSAAIGRSLLVVAGGRLWRLDGERWTELGPARAVAQPH